MIVYFSVSYLFRSLGSLVALSVGSTLMQDTLRTHLQQRLTGSDAEEVCIQSDYIKPIALTLLTSDYSTGPRIFELYSRT